MSSTINTVLTHKPSARNGWLLFYGWLYVRRELQKEKKKRLMKNHEQIR